MDETRVDILLHELNEVRDINHPPKSSQEQLESQYHTSLQENILPSEHFQNSLSSQLEKLDNILNRDEDDPKSVFPGFSNNTQNALQQIKQLQIQKQSLLSIQTNINLLKELNEKLETNPISSLNQTEIEKFAKPINDPKMEPIISSNPHLKEFKKYIIDLSKQSDNIYLYNPKVYYDRFEKAVISLLKTYFNKNIMDPKHMKLINLLSKISELTNKIHSLKSIYNADNHFDDNLFYIAEPYFTSVLKYPIESKQECFKALFEYCAKGPEHFSVIDKSLYHLLEQLNSDLSNCFNNMVFENRKIQEEIASFIRLTKPEWFNSTNEFTYPNIYRNWILNVLDTLKDKKTSTYAGLVKYFFENGYQEVFQSFINSYRFHIQDQITTDISIRYSSIDYLLHTNYNDIDKNCENYIIGKNIVLYGALYNYFIYDTSKFFVIRTNCNKLEKFVKQMKREIVGDIFTTLYKKIHQVIDLSLIYENIQLNN